MSASKQTASPSLPQRDHSATTTSASPTSTTFAQQLGNQNLQVLLRARLLQAKLSVSDPHDAHEQEADRVAEHVMRMPDSSPRVETQSAPLVQRSEEAAEKGPTVDAALEHSINALSGRGNALPESTRAFMEPRFNADFSGVRVHTDAHAHELARAVNAQAFTIGRNVVFNAGRFAPETESGKRLLAHELTHVVQQSSAPRHVARAVEDVFKGPVSAVDEWLKGPVDVSAMNSFQLQAQLDELQQYHDRQIGSSTKLTRIEEAIVLLEQELARKTAPVQPATAPRGRGKGGKTKSKAPAHPERRPRVLTEKGSPIYATPAEARAEYDLVVQWLAVKGLPAKDRTTLALERDNLASQVQGDRERAFSNRHSARVRAALTPSDRSNATAALISVTRTIDSMSKDPANDGVFYIYHQGERIAISADQAAGLRKDLIYELTHAAGRLRTTALYAMARFRAQVKENDEHWLVARAAELFGGHFWGVDDPTNALQARLPRVVEGEREILAHLAAGRLLDAAALLPEIEKLSNEMSELAREFKEGYLDGAERAVTVLTYTAKAAAAIELSLLTVAAAPLVAGYVGGFVGVEGLGLTGFAGTAVTTLGTAGGTGLVVGGGNALFRGGTAFGVALASGKSVGDAFHASTGEATQGFYDGFIAGAGGGAARILAPALGVGANLSYQAARRAGAEAIVNGTTTLVHAIASGKPVAEAIKEATESALLSIPAALVGGKANDIKRLIAGSLTASGTAYAGALLKGASTEEALSQAGIALASHVVVSTAKHGSAGEAAATKRGQRAGKAVKNTVIKTVAAVAIGAAKAPPHLSAGGPRVVPHDTPATSARVTREPPAPTPDPVHSDQTAPAVAKPPAYERLDLSDGAPTPGKTPFKMTAQELQYRAAEALRRPIRDLSGRVHFYDTVEEFNAEFIRKYPNQKLPRGYFEPETGDIHVSPEAEVDTAVHETMHNVREDENQWGSRYVGAFLDEGVTDAIARGRTTGNLDASGYRKNIAFYRLLKRALGGSDVVENAILHGEYGAMRAKIKQLFGGSEARTFEFFSNLRSIGSRAQNPRPLDRAVAMLEEASGQPAWQLSKAGPARSPAPGSRNAKIERIGPFSFLSQTKVETHPTGRVLSRRVGALVRSGVPIAREDVGPFLEQLMTDAKGAGATVLRVFPEFIQNPDVPALKTLAEAFDGTALKTGSAVVIEIPLVPRPKPTAARPTPATARRSAPAPTAPAARAGATRGTRRTPDSSIEDEKSSGVPVSANEAADTERTIAPPAMQDAKKTETPPSSGASPRRQVRAIVYVGGRLADGSEEPDRLVTTWDGEGAYISTATGHTPHGQAGTPVVKVKGDVHRFVGVQVETRNFKHFRGWMIKHEAYTNMAPIPELRNVEFVIEARLTQPEEVNDWLTRNGAIPYIDVEHYLGHLPPDPE